MKRTILITGANRGIGLALAKRFAATDWSVFLTARKPEDGGAAAAGLSQNGRVVTFVPLDVASQSSIAAAAESVAAATDHLDVLINNAGMLGDKSGNALELRPELLRQTLETNTIGPLLVTQAFTPLLARSEAGRVINISSMAGSLQGMDSFAPAYSISKAALNAVTRQLSAALRSQRISVNSVSPGWVRTEMGGAGAPRSVEEGAEGIFWLATEAPADLTGQFLQDRRVVPW